MFRLQRPTSAHVKFDDGAGAHAGGGHRRRGGRRGAPLAVSAAVASTGSARVSLAVIARDEEAMLPDCLASARDAVDEMVVLDTGSRDATRELARRAGARVVEIPWPDDFAAARNAAVLETRGDWVLMLDADERLAPG